MEIKVRNPKDNIAILDVIGEIDIYNSSELKKTVQRSMDNGINHIIFNLEKVPYIDSSGIGAMIASLTKLRRAKGSMKIFNAFESVKKVFELTKMTSFFEIYNSEEEALKNIK